MFDRLRASVLRSVGDELVALADEVSPSVVTVRVADSGLSGSSGSGWVLSKGLVVTNAHVVQGSDPIFKLRLGGGQLVSAELVGSDIVTDLALLRAETDRPPLELRTEPARLGELCFAFGSPLGEFTESVTFGIVSGLNRRLELENGLSIESVLQTDAEINPGNSGGPLVDLDGRLIGVNTAIRADGRGVGFAVPARTVASIVPELAEHGEVVRPRIGIAIDVVDHRSDGKEQERLRVSDSDPDNPIQPGDLLVSIAGRTIASRTDLFEVLRRPLIGVPTTAVVERNGEIVTVDLHLGA